MRIAVLMGGTSPEREISLISGKAVANGLEEKGHEVESIDFDRLGIEELIKLDPEVVFIALHGCPGEDGSVQGLLELLGLPYTGAGVLGSSLAINKGMTKRILQTDGLPTPTGIVLGPDYSLEHSMVMLQSIGVNFPLVIKPASGGSTIGVTVAQTSDEINDGIKEAQKYDKYCLVEEFIRGPEITVSILDEEVLPSLQIVAESGFYDYEAKYTEGKSRHIHPPEIDPESVKFAEELVLNGYHLLGLSGMARAEVIFNDEDRPHILEYNTIPGFTKLSLFPDSARQAGIEFPDLCDKLIRMAIRDRGGRRIR